MVKSINEIGQVMGKQTIAEFVENNDILEKLREIGVNYAQGYGIGRPRRIQEIPASGVVKRADKAAHRG
ncbi:MAG: EAL domain-containing protein [Acidiferrobacterales bacterium]